MKPSTSPKPHNVGEIDGFIDLLRASCDDQSINTALEKLLSMPDEKRQVFVHNWVTDLVMQGAPRAFTQAIACLLDDAVAEKAYEVIYQCRR
jgi:hypothetical protein